MAPAETTPEATGGGTASGSKPPVKTISTPEFGPEKQSAPKATTVKPVVKKAPKSQLPKGYSHPVAAKPHKPQLTPKSQLPKDYKHPIASERAAAIVKPSKEMAEREAEQAKLREEGKAKPVNWYDLPDRTGKTPSKAKKKKK